MKTILFSCILITSLWSFENLHYVNKRYKITDERELQSSYASLISPLFNNQKIQYFKSSDNLKIAYKIFEVKNAKANIVISSGRTDGMLKYQEFIYDMNQNSYSVFILDHRGQGHSQRMLDDSQIGYVNSFDDYVDDLHMFTQEYVPKDKKLILIGHSMGGAIASLYVEAYRDDFDGVVLSSPMHQPDLINTTVSGMICSIMKLRKHDIKRYVIGEKSYDDALTPFDENLLTHSKLRYTLVEEAYNKEPRTKIGGPSVKWVKEACIGSEKSVANADKIKIPLLLLQAKEDQIVNLAEQNIFCKKSYPYCKGYSVKGAYHEIFIEKDIIREKVISKILDFISTI